MSKNLFIEQLIAAGNAATKEFRSEIERLQTIAKNAQECAERAPMYDAELIGMSDKLARLRRNAAHLVLMLEYAKGYSVDISGEIMEILTAKDAADDNSHNYRLELAKRQQRKIKDHERYEQNKLKNK